MSSAPASAKPKNPLSEPEPWNLVSAGYDEVTRAILEKYSAWGVAQLSLESQHRVLDVACGPGTTTLLVAPHVSQVEALDFSAEMLRIARTHLAERNLQNVQLHEGDGQNLPFADAGFDRAISMFGLMFFPDRRRGMREVHRVLKAGGQALISSWAPVALSPAMMAMFGALRAIDPSRPAPETDITSLENPEVFEAELREAGFTSVRIEPVEQTMEFGSPEAFWDGMVKGSAPLVLLRKRLGEPEFQRQSQIAYQFLRDHLGVRRSLSSTAYLAFAQK